MHRLSRSGTRQARFLARTFAETRLKTHITRDRLLLHDRTAWNKLWRRTFHPLWQPGIPTEDLDFAWLAGFDKLTGGTIYSAAVHAAFLAAQRGHAKVTMADVADAIKAEYAKLNQPLRPAELAVPSAPRRVAKPAPAGM